MNEKISIIIPVYNAEKYIRQCLDSVLNQSYQNLQIICIDDDSTDSSLDILNEYKEKDNRIDIIHKDNEGVSLARNIGLNKANGEYILFVDSDDWIDTSTCAKAVSVMEQNKADLVMWSYIREWNGERKPKQIFNKDIFFDKSSVEEKLHRRMIGILGDELEHPENADALCTVWGKLYKRSIIFENNIHFYDIRKIGTYEDGLFNLDYFSYVKSALFINEYFYHYRKTNADSITCSYNPRLQVQWMKLFALMDNYIVNKNLGDNYKQALRNRVSLSLIPLGINVMTKDSSFGEKIKEIGNIVYHKRYKSAIRTLELKYLPIHWRIFFLAARTKNILVISLMLCVIQRIRGK